MGRNIGKNYAIPASAQYATIPRSDGHSSTWPRQTVEEVDSDGCVNWMKRLDGAESGSIKWRCTVGMGLAAHFHWEGDSDKWVLQDWPNGYALFDHHKGKVENPRHDLYLFGYRAKFRSPAEFLPHAIYLSTDEAVRQPCKCKYCTGNTQREITHEMRETGIYIATHAFSPRPGARRTQQPKKKPIIHDIGLHASVQKVPKVGRSAAVLKFPMIIERNNDLRASTFPSSSNMKRWHREHELVWTSLLQPITGAEEHQCIKFWPGIIQDLKVEKTTVRKSSPLSPSANGALPSEDARNGHSESVVQGERAPPPWSVVERQKYRIQLLGVSTTCLLSEDHVLPYQAYAQPRQLLDALQAIHPSVYAIDGNVSTFNPTSSDATWNTALSPYVLAIQIAGALSSFWNLTDEWEVKVSLPSSSSISAPPAAKPPSQNSLTEVMNQAHIQNSSSASAGPSNGAYRNVSAPRKDLSEAETSRTAKLALGEPSTTVPHFQGMWWGGERIWTDELIRLKAPRRCFAPDGTEAIYAPASPGPKSLEQCAAQGWDPMTRGAGLRGMFLLVQRIFVVEVVEPGMRKKETRVSGMLYELADEDWVETQAAPPEASGSNGATTSLGGLRIPKVSDGLSHPLLSNRLPPPPRGFQFRPILKPGHEAVLSLTMVSGRYYPRVLEHPLLFSSVDDMLTQGTEHEGHLLWALEGLSSGVFNAVEPIRYISSRAKMIEEADSAARVQLKKFFGEKLEHPNVQEEVPPVGEAMDVDG